MFKVFGFLFGMAFLSIGAFCLIPFGGGKRDNSDTLFCLALIAGGLTLSLFAMGGIEELVSALIAFFEGTVFGVLFFAACGLRSVRCCRLRVRCLGGWKCNLALDFKPTKIDAMLSYC